MKNPSRIITGSIIIVLAFIFIVSFKGDLLAVFLGLFSLIIGFYILLNEKEDEIEKIKNKNN